MAFVWHLAQLSFVHQSHWIDKLHSFRICGINFQQFLSVQCQTQIYWAVWDYDSNHISPWKFPRLLWQHQIQSLHHIPSMIFFIELVHNLTTVWNEDTTAVPGPVHFNCSLLQLLKLTAWECFRVKVLTKCMTSANFSWWRENY